ncbi:MAG TPA: hypothetical protein DCY20_05340 [Firmicutes bacterium]|nr:hypothetical protein [Bacillota bacterium]
MTTKWRFDMRYKLGKILFCLIFVTIFGIAVLTYLPIQKMVKEVSYFGGGVEHAYANLKDVPIIEGNEVDQFIEKYPNVLIIDVRDNREYKEGHIKGAINIPLKDINQKIDEIKSLNPQSILLYCKTGKRSAEARNLLNKAELKDTYIINKGLQNYKGELVQ